MDSIFILNMVFLFAVGIYLGILKKNNQLTEAKFALTAISFCSFFTVTTIHSVTGIPTTTAILIDCGFLVVWWGLGYPVARWLYRQWNS